MKKILAVLLAVIMMASIFAVPVLAEGGDGAYPSREEPPPTPPAPPDPGMGYSMSTAIIVMAIVLSIGTAAVVVTGRKYFCEK